MARWVLSDRAADWMRAQMNAGYTGEAGPARLRARDASMPLDPPQHFAIARRVTSGVASWQVGEGAVQDGTDTVWFQGGTVQPNTTGESIVYAQLNTTSKVVTVGVVASTSALAALQQTTGVVVWPLYHMTDAVVDMDYRPLFTRGGDSPSPTTSIPGPFEPVHDATTGLLTGFTHCIYCAERQFVECGSGGTMSISGVTASTYGYVVLTLPHDAYASATASGAPIIDDNNVGVAIENVLPMNDSDAVTKIPLYHVTAGVVDVDLRAVPTGVLAR